MLLAVNIPEQLPQVGQAAFSISSSSSADILPFCFWTPRDERVDQVDRLSRSRPAGLHRAAGNEDRRDVDPHRSHEHAGHDLVAVGNAHHRVEAVGLDHGLDAVGDQLARRQRKLHPVVPHGDAVVDTDRVEQKRHAAGGPHALLHVIADSLKMDVARDDVDVAVADRDERLVPVAFAHAGRPEQASMGCAGIPLLDRVGTHDADLDI